MILSMKQIADGVLEVTPSGKAHRKSVPISQGLAARQAPRKLGRHELTPNQMLDLCVEIAAYNGSGLIEGYQRDPSKRLPDIREMARAMQRGQYFEDPLLGLDEASGQICIVNGAGRILGSIMARQNRHCIIEKLDYKQRVAAFMGQRKQRAIPPANLVMGMRTEDPVGDYVCDAVEATEGGRPHPWSDLISYNSTKTRISMNLAWELIAAYAYSLRSATLRRTYLEGRKFESGKADELALLLRCFGTKSTNPIAFETPSLKAVVSVAVLAIERPGRKSEDIKRWQKHMARFPWSDYPWVRRRSQWTEELVRYWNRRLPPERKVEL